MKSVQCSHPAADAPIVEQKAAVESIAALRNVVLRLALMLAKEDPTKAGVLLLHDPKITDKRIAADWLLVRLALNPKIAARLSVCVVRFGKLIWASDNKSIALPKNIARLQIKGAPVGRRLPRWNAIDEVTKLMILQWIRNEGPRTAEWYGRMVGCSYPTVAEAASSVRHLVKRSDRKIELNALADSNLLYLDVNAFKTRSTIRFADRSGQPRSIEGLLKRFRGQGRPDIAIGGVLAALHYNPQLNIIGNPRLDLLMHCNGQYANIDFVERLDPALQQTDDPQEPDRLVIHFLRRKESFFVIDKHGTQWADQLECIFDLSDLRLHELVSEMVAFYKQARKKPK